MGVKRYLAMLAIILGAGWSATAHAGQPRFIGFTIGVSDYGAASLSNPVKDADMIAQALQKAGATVRRPLLDPDLKTYRLAMNSFLEELRGYAAAGDDVTVFVYFSGHGIATEDDEWRPHQYLLPKGTNLLTPGADPAYAAGDAIDAGILRQQLVETGAHRVVLVLDACRKIQVPWHKAGPAAGIDRLPPMSWPNSKVLTLYASQQDSFALEQVVPGGGNPFAEALSTALQSSRTMAELIDAVGDQVYRATSHRQMPQSDNSMNFSFPGFRATASAVPSAPGGLKEAVWHDPQDVDLLGNIKSAVAPPGGFTALQAAASSGDGTAAMKLGVAYEQGIGTDKSFDLARYWFGAAIADGEPRATAFLGAMYYNGELGQKDAKEAARWWTVGASRGARRSQYELGKLYLNGEGSLPKDPKTAAQLFDLAIKQNYPEAFFDKAFMLRNGTLGKANPGEAADLCRRGVALDSAKCAYLLADMTARGEGVTADQAEANRLYRQGLTLGRLDIAPVLADRYDAGTGLPKADPEGATRIYCDTAARGDAEAMQQCGTRVIKGIGQPVSREKGIAWYRKAAALGSVGGRDFLGAELIKPGASPTEQSEGMTILATLVHDEITGHIDPTAWPMYYYFAGLTLSNALGNRSTGTVGPLDLTVFRRLYPSGAKIEGISIPLECYPAGSTIDIKTPFTVWVFDWPRETEVITPQLDWVSRERGCRLPASYAGYFPGLLKWARASKKSFVDAINAAIAKQQQDRDPLAMTFVGPH